MEIAKGLGLYKQVHLSWVSQRERSSLNVDKGSIYYSSIPKYRTIDFLKPIRDIFKLKIDMNSFILDSAITKIINYLKRTTNYKFYYFQKLNELSSLILKISHVDLIFWNGGSIKYYCQPLPLPTFLKKKEREKEE